MKISCPKCQIEIPLEDVNVAADIALCRRCGQTQSYADLLEGRDIGPIDLSRPPRGMWLVRKPAGFELGFSLRSAAALFLVPFTLFWGGMSMGGIYGTQITKGEFQLTESLFGIPFLLGTIFLVSFSLLTICGKQVLKVDPRGAEIFTGIGGMGFRRRFQWNEIRKVMITTHRGSKGRVSRQLTLDGDTSYHLGNGQKDERLHYALAFLRPLVGHPRAF